MADDWKIVLATGGRAKFHHRKDPLNIHLCKIHEMPSDIIARTLRKRKRCLVALGTSADLRDRFTVSETADCECISMPRCRKGPVEIRVEGISDLTVGGKKYVAIIPYDSWVREDSIVKCINEIGGLKGVKSIAKYASKCLLDQRKDVSCQTDSVGTDSSCQTMETMLHDPTCIFCLDKPPSYASRCGHKCLCEDCVLRDMFRTCPVCRASTAIWVKIYD